MFSQLFFILLALLLINSIPDNAVDYWIIAPSTAFTRGLLLYLLVLIGLYGQSKYWPKRYSSLWWPIVNIELLVFLAIYHFGLGAHRLLKAGIWSTYQSPFIFTSLTLYFFGLGWAAFWYGRFKNHQSTKKAFKTAYRQLLFYFPFCLPYIIITLLLDGLENSQILQNQAPEFTEGMLLFLGVVLLGATILFFPTLITFCWRCKPLMNPEIKKHLEDRCASLNFKHAGLKVWSTLPHAFTAGIIGIAPAFRYILFTPPLLSQFSKQELEAILIHEIGHNRHRHLLFYPFILMGMLMAGAWLWVGLEVIFSDFSDAPLDFGLIMGEFILYAGLMGAYFRFIFGFFSRLFERQADLYIFETSLSPMFLVQALDHLGVVTGYSHHHPNWHHFSLQERIRFIQRAMANPELIQNHHRRVKYWLWIYFTFLLLSGLAFYYLFM